MESEWVAYFCALVAPFIQEDAAVLGAASASVAGIGNPHLMFAAITIGLTLSDLWKYWLGRAATTHQWAGKYADSPRVTLAQDKIVNNLGKSLLFARFIPGTRIPLYIASGFFNAPFGKFAAFIILSAMLYIGIAFSLFYAVGEVAGEEAKKYLPVIALGALAIFLIAKRIKSKSKPEQI